MKKTGKSKAGSSLSKQSNGGQTLIEGAMILTVGIILVKIIGAVFKIPLGNIIGATGMGYYSTAYSLYLPIYTLAAAGFPSAIARQVAENITLGRYKDAQKVQRIAIRVFLITGTLGFIAMAVAGIIITNYGSVSHNAIYAILAMSPSVFFCCVMSSYRGYYEGLRNMVPTAASQVIEALGKLIIGLGLAVVIMEIGKNTYLDASLVAGAGASGSTTVNVYGVECHSFNDALNASYPLAAGGALFGIMLGSVFGMIYMIIRSKKLGMGFTKQQLSSAPEPQSGKEILKNFLIIGIPIALGVLAVNLTQLIDTFTIQSRLQQLDMAALRAEYGDSMADVSNTPKEIANFLWGSYNFGITIYNLLPYITQALGVSALPALAAAWTAKNAEKIEESINSVVKMAVLVCFPAGLGVFALSGEILQLLYPGKPGADICEPMLRVLGLMILFGSMAAPINSMLQAVGKQAVPVKLMVCGAVIKLVMNYTLVGTQSINIKGAPYGSLACYVFIVVCSLVVLCRTTKVKMDVKSTFIKPFIAAVLCGVTAFGVNKLMSLVITSKINVVLAIGFGGIVYVVSLLLTRAISKKDVLMLPKGEKIAKILEKRGWIV